MDSVRAQLGGLLLLMATLPAHGQNLTSLPPANFPLNGKETMYIVQDNKSKYIPAADIAGGSTGTSSLFINVTSPPYNAICDGTADDTPAIQSAFNAGTTSGQPFTLLLPSRVCKTTSALMVNGASAQNISIRGVSRATSQLLVTGTGDGLDINMAPITGQVYAGMLDVSDFTMLATGSAGTAIKAVSSAPNSVSPKFTNLRIGYLSGGSFANGISTALMSNLVVHNVNINSPNPTGVAFTFDGNAVFPSITNNFSDIYFFGFAVGIQPGNGTTSYVQGVEVTNAQLQQSGHSCIKWNNNPSGFLADQLLVSNSFCNGSININNVENVVLTGNYFLATGIIDITLVVATTFTINGNTFLANGAANSTGITVVSGFGVINSNHFYSFQGSNSAAIIFDASASNSIAVGNLCTTCGTTSVVNDFGANFKDGTNINVNDTVRNSDNIQRSWQWQVPGSPTLATSGTTLGWNYQGQGEADVFLGRGVGGAHGYSMVWYDATSGVGAQLMGLTVDGNLVIPGLLSVGGNTGVTCSGTPTSSFASTGGAVTHC